MLWYGSTDDFSLTLACFIPLRVLNLLLTIFYCLMFQIVRRWDGASRGFGFVTFADEMSVEKCLVVQHELNNKRVDLRRAVPKEQMAALGGFPGAMPMPGLRGYGAMGAYGGGGMGVSELNMGYGMGGYNMSPMGGYEQDFTGGRPRIQGPRGTNRFRPY